MAARKDLGLYFKIQYKEAGAFRPKRGDVSTCDCTVKILWAQWDQLEIRDEVLCRRWEEERGSRAKYQIIFGTGHTTTSHRGVKKHLERLGLDTGQDEFYKSELVMRMDSKGIWERREVHY